MDFLNFPMALSPIVVVLVGILGFKKSAKAVSPIALAWTLILAFTYFNLDGLTFAENVKVLDPLVWKGIKEGLKIVLMVFGAFTILNLLRETGAIEDVKATIAQISDDRRVQVVIIGMMLPIARFARFRTRKYIRIGKRNGLLPSRILIPPLFGIILYLFLIY